MFLGHMGGPFWESKDDGGWSIPKGEYDAATEDPMQAARREFAEEIAGAHPRSVGQYTAAGMGLRSWWGCFISCRGSCGQ